MSPISDTFLPHDAMLERYMLSLYVCLSMSVSHTPVLYRQSFNILRCPRCSCLTACSALATDVFPNVEEINCKLHIGFLSVSICLGHW